MLCSFRSMVEPARQPAAGRPAGRFQPPSRWRSGIGQRRAGGLVSRRWSTRGSSAAALAQPGPLAIFLTPGPDAGRWNGAKPRRRLSRRRTLFVLLSVVPIFRPSSRRYSAVTKSFSFSRPSRASADCILFLSRRDFRSLRFVPMTSRPVLLTGARGDAFSAAARAGLKGCFARVVAGAGRGRGERQPDPLRCCGEWGGRSTEAAGAC